MFDTIDSHLARQRGSPAKSLLSVYAENDVGDLRLKLAHRQLNPFGPRGVPVTRLVEDNRLNGKPI